jgi:hypothetical protein
MVVLVLTVAVFFIPSCSLMKTGTPVDALTGNWEGSITIPDGTVIDVYMEFFSNADGDYQAFLKVPQQSEDTMLIRNVVLDSQKLTFTVEEAPADFVGKVESKDTITGEFTQGGHLMPIVFKRTQ